MCVLRALAGIELSVKLTYERGRFLHDQYNRLKVLLLLQLKLAVIENNEVRCFKNFQTFLFKNVYALLSVTNCPTHDAACR